MPVEVSAELRKALQTYSEIERHLVGIGRRADPSHRLELVRWRRKLAEQTGTVGKLLEEDPILARNPAKHEEMSRIFTTFRYALGHHIAKWPAVRIDEDMAAYAESARDAYGKADIFWHWCAVNLDLRRH